jgi:hypothetical protein
MQDYSRQLIFNLFTSIMRVQAALCRLSETVAGYNPATWDMQLEQAILHAVQTKTPTIKLLVSARASDYVLRQLEVHCTVQYDASCTLCWVFHATIIGCEPQSPTVCHKID